MLEQLILREFQCHRRLVVDLNHSVVVLTGSSDAGKSTVIRSIKWLATNRPAGTGFIHRGGETDEGRTASAHLHVDGRAVKRVRGKGRNAYRIDGRSLKAFGAGVPEPVERLLNLGSINFAGQHDSTFLFSLSPGECARALNEVINLSEIDRVQTRLAAELRKARATAEVCEARLGEVRTRRDALAWVPDAATAYAAVEARFAVVDSLRERVGGISHLLERSQATREIFRVAGGALPVLARVLELGKRVQPLRQQVILLANLIQQAAEAQKVILRSNREADTMAARLAAVPRCPVCGSPKKL